MGFHKNQHHQQRNNIQKKVADIGTDAGGETGEDADGETDQSVNNQSKNNK